MLKSPLSPEQLAYFQEIHYTERIAQTKDPVAKKWLQKQLDGILNVNDTTAVDLANKKLSIEFKNNLKINK